ncbi:NYN domain-containing protein [Candidatus Omnitrophota bacterium]
MPLRFIIDGYNTINHSKFLQLASKKIKDPRLALLSLIKSKSLTGSPRNKVVVVFDGYADRGARLRDYSDIEIISSGKDSADSKIKKIAEACANPRNIVVVTDDKDIRHFVRSVGCALMNVDEFIDPEKGVSGKKKREGTVKPELNYTQVKKINEELGKIWLK